MKIQPARTINALTAFVMALAITFPVWRAAADDLALNPAWLPPDVQSIAHFNVHAFTQSTMGRILLDEQLAPEIAEARAQMKQEFGLDLFTDALSVTAYTRTAWGDDGGALIAIATAAVDDFIQLLIEQEDFGYKPLIADGRTLHTWNIAESDDRAIAYIGPMPKHDGRRLVIVADQADRITDALKTIEAAGNVVTIDGASADDAASDGGSKSDQTLQIAPPAGAIFYAASLQMNRLPDFDASSQVLREAREALFVMHEDSDGVTISELTLRAESEQQARDLNDVATGMLALARLMTRNDDNPELAMLGDLIRATTIRSRDRSLLLRLELTESMIREMARLSQ